MITRENIRGSGTKKRIVEAALGLFVAQGISATTTREIADRAGIAEGTIYRHFESKDALANEMFLDGFVPFSNFLAQLDGREGTLVDKVEMATAQFYRLFDADPTLWMYIMTFQTGEQSKVPKGTPTPFSVLRDLLETATRSGELRDFDADLGVQILLGIIEHPAEGVAYGELSGPLTPRLPEVIGAIRRVLST